MLLLQCLEMCREFATFNRRLGGLFDGIDWDLEGNDDRQAPTARFTIDTLDVMADFSVCAKAQLGLSVSLAPAESYLDALGPSGEALPLQWWACSDDGCYCSVLAI